MSDPVRVALTMEQLWHRVPGGTAVAALELAGALRRRADVVPVGVAARHSGKPPRAFRSSIPVHSLALPRLLLYESWARLRRPAVERATGPVDLIHATAVAIPPASVPVVLTVHDLAWRHEPDHFTPRGVHFFRQHLEVAKRDVALVFCSSEATRKDCLEAGFAPERLRVVPLGARSIETTDEAIQLARAKHRLRRPYVMWAGTREPRKNLAGLLAAFVELDRKDLDLVLVGPPGWGDEIDTVIAGHDRAGSTCWGSSIGPSRPRSYAGASAFCFPSLREGFGLPVLEAMNQGTPVVTSLGTATEEVAGEAAKLVEPRDPSAMAEALAEVLDDARLARDLGRRGRARAAEYTWERSAQLVVDGYREVLGMTVRVAVNLLWLRPGVVGGSEELICGYLGALADRPASAWRARARPDPVLAPRDSTRRIPTWPGASSRFRVPTVPWGRPGRVGVESVWLPRRIGDFDVVHHAGGTLPGRARPASLVTIHDLQPLDRPEAFGAVKRRWLQRQLPGAVDGADALHVTTRFVADGVADRFPGHAGRVTVVPPVVPALGSDSTADRTAGPARAHRSLRPLPGHHLPAQEPRNSDRCRRRLSPPNIPICNWC